MPQTPLRFIMFRSRVKAVREADVRAASSIVTTGRRRAANDRRNPDD